MDRLQHLLTLREKNSSESSDSPLKLSDSIHKYKAQSRRFQEAKQTLSSQLTNIDSLFERWSEAMAKDFNSFNKLFSLVENQFISIYNIEEKKHRPSLIAYTETVKELIESNQIVCLKPRAGRSQLFQLILGLLIEYRIENTDRKVIIYTSQEVQKEYEYFYLNHQRKDTIDLQHDYRQQLLRQIANLEIRYFENRTKPKPTDSEALVVFDIFGCCQSLYGPLFNLVSQKKLFKKMLVHVDDESKVVYDELVETNARFPVEIVSDGKNLKETVYKILDQSKLYAVISDIIIFTTTPQTQKSSLQDFIKNTKFKVNIVTGTEAYDFNNNNIFIASNQKELASWRYNYKHVIAIFDYGVASKIHFSVEEKIYTEIEQEISQKEMERRISFLGALKPGKYFQLFKWRPSQLKPFEKQDLSLYILSMLSLSNDIEAILKGKSQSIKVALEKSIEMLKELKIIQVSSGKGHILDKTIHDYDISPFFAKILLELKGKRSQANILTYLIAALITPGSLKKSQNKNTHNIWKKDGDLSIYAQILYVYELQIENTKKGQGNKPEEQDADAANENEFAMFGNLYNQYKIKPKLLLSQMSAELILTQLDLNENFLTRCLDNVRKIRNMFKLKFIQYEDINDQIPEVLEILVKTLDNGAVYTGSRRFGYKMKSGPNYLLAKQNIFNILNERPNLILPLKIVKHQNKQPEIVLMSKIPEEMYLINIGDIPICSQKSSFSDTQVEFTGVSNAMFEAIWKGSFIPTFQKKHACLVEPNEEIASIIIFCSKHSKALITEEFKTFMESVKTKLETQVKPNQYHVWQLIFQKGGSIKEILDKNDTRQIKLVNIPLETTTEQIKQLLEDYSELDNIVVQEDTVNKTKTALITFSTTNDLKWAVDQLDSTLFEGKKLKFLEAPKKAEIKKIEVESFVKFKWYAWPLTKKGTGIVIFKSNEAALKAAAVFNRPFDGKEVVAEVKDNSLHLKGLNEKTDEIFLKSRLQMHGQIEDVQLEKVQTQQANNAQTLVQYHVKNYIQKDELFEIVYVNKMSHGLRVAKVKIFNPQTITRISAAPLNQSFDVMGKTRLYIEPQYVHPILIPDHKMQKIYHDILHQSIQQLKIDLNSIKIKTLKHEKNTYIVLKSSNNKGINLIVNSMNSKLKQEPIQLTKNNTQIFFSELGKQLLNRTEQQYKCKFVYDDFNKKLGVICKQNVYEQIIGELYILPTLVMEDIVVCSMKTYKHLCKNPAKLQEIRVANVLQDVSIDHISKSIRIKGLPYHIKQTRQALLFHLLNINNQNDGESAEFCGICCQVLNRPYRLQICGHSFCEQCLMFSINNAFGDASCFPLKCPHCLIEICIQDLNALLDPQSWAKLTNIAVNDYVNKHGDRFGFCYTPNCRGLYNSREEHFECKVCFKSYCTLCKRDYHRGLTCQEAKDDNEALLRKYMEENDVRICPNPGCKMLIQRIDGCYRVTCSTCNQSICFKCPKENMMIYPTADECYKHLNDAHGGYW